MKPSPLAIEGYYVEELSVSLTPKYKKKQEYLAWIGFHFQPESMYKPDPVTFDVFGDLAQNRDEHNRWRYEIQIKSHESKRKNFPYSFNVGLVGYFRVDEKLPENVKRIFINASAPAILYAAARELLATVTGRGPYPAIILPSVSFMDNVEKMAAEMAKRIKPIEEKRVITKKAVKKGTKKRASKKATK